MDNAEKNNLVPEVAEMPPESERVPKTGGSNAGQEASARAEAASANTTGIYNFRGMLIGDLHLLDNTGATKKEEPNTPPPGLTPLQRLTWILSAECRFNFMTLFEMYICLVGLVWGGFLLLPYSSFDGAGKIWIPIRTVFDASPGGPWYDRGAEYVVGATLFIFHGMHLFSLCHGRMGDVSRRLTICVLLSLWASLGVLFWVADHTVPNYAVIVVNVTFLFFSLVSVFRKAAVR